MTNPSFYYAGNTATTFILSTDTCLCRAFPVNQTAILTLGAANGFNINLVGSCANYNAPNTTCQNVYYSNVGCLAVDGSSCVIPS